MTHCPHCGALTRVEPSAALGWRCGVCAGPVVPTEGLERPHAELEHLVRAQRARAMVVGWTGAALVLGATAAMAALVALLVWGGAHGAAVILAATAACAAVLSLASRRRARGHARAVGAALDAAWQRAAEEIVTAKGGEITAPELARILGTDEARAETLLSGLSTAGRAHARVRDDAELAYRVDDAAAPAMGAGTDAGARTEVAP